jgi:hypothetical protein
VARLARERSCAKALGVSALQPLVDLLHADTVSMRCKEHALKALRYLTAVRAVCAPIAEAHVGAFANRVVRDGHATALSLCVRSLTHGALHACARRRQGMALNPHGSSLLRLGLPLDCLLVAREPAVHRLRLLHLMAS